MEKVYLHPSPIHGTGVFALAAIPTGHPILKIDDSRLVTPENPLDAALGEFEHHCDYLASGKVVLMRSPERHVNHRCSPNTIVKTIHGVRYLFAISMIAAGEEITNDYCINGFGDTIWQCHCGAPRCRKEIHSDFFHLPLALQLEYLPLLDSWYLDQYQDSVAALLRQAGLST